MVSPELTIPIAIVLGIVLITVVLFISGWLRVDVVALLIMVALPLLGLIDGRKAFQGLGSTARLSPALCRMSAPRPCFYPPCSV